MKQADREYRQKVSEIEQAAAGLDQAVGTRGFQGFQRSLPGSADSIGTAPWSQALQYMQSGQQAQPSRVPLRQLQPFGRQLSEQAKQQQWFPDVDGAPGFLDPDLVDDLVNELNGQNAGMCDKFFSEYNQKYLHWL